MFELSISIQQRTYWKFNICRVLCRGSLYDFTDLWKIIYAFFLDNDVENDLQSDLSRALQDADWKAERMPLLLNSGSSGFTEPDFGSLGLSAAKKDPPSKVLPGSKCCLQLL